MTLFEVVFKITHECPFANVSRKFPSMKMFSWCNGEHDIYEIIVEKHEEYEEVLKDIAKLGGIAEESSDQHKAHLITKTCTCNKENSINKNFDDFDLLHVSPIAYAQGWEYYRVIAFKHEDIGKLLQRLEANGVVCEIVRKVPFNGFIASSLTLTSDALFSDLTEKQMDALLAAYNNGYYRFPRKSDIQTIAAKKRVPRTTFQEHLKKAENKIVASLVPYVQLYRRASVGERESLKIK